MQLRPFMMGTILTAAVGSATAGMISIDPTNGVTASAEFTHRWDDHLVDGSGLSEGLHGAIANNTMWLGIGSAEAFVVFDLGGVYSITNIHVWNYNEAAAGLSTRGVSNVVVRYGTNLTFGFDSAFESTLAEVTTFAKAPGAAGYTGEAFDSFSAFETRYVLFDVVDTHGDANAGLSEVQFYGTFVRNYAPTPEITNVTVESVSSTSDPWAASKTVDESGLNILGHHAANSGMWLSGNDSAPEIVYDLGDVYDIELMEVWNSNYHVAANDLTARGIKDVDILGSEDGTNFSAIVSTTFAEAPGSSTNDFSETVPLTATARYVKLDIVSNHEAGSFTGLSEIKFYGDLWGGPPGAVLVIR